MQRARREPPFLTQSEPPTRLIVVVVSLHLVSLVSISLRSLCAFTATEASENFAFLSRRLSVLGHSARLDFSAGWSGLE